MSAAYDRLKSLLEHVVEVDASDLHIKVNNLHIKVNNPPILRVRGDLKRLDMPALSESEVEAMFDAVLNDERRERLNNFKECDLSFAVPGLARFRVNLYWQQGRKGGVFRLIPYRIKTIEACLR